MDIVINEELKAYIDPLTEEEEEALERSILAEGCRDALVLWCDVLVDGHNRCRICRKHDLPFQTVQNTRFQSIEDVHPWMIDQHLGRRSISDFQRGVLALRKREIVADSREALAKAARLSSNQVVMIEKIQKQAARKWSPPSNPAPAANAGKDELKQAARRARESRRKPREEPAATPQDATEPDELQTLRQRVAELTAENEALRCQLAALAAA